VKYFPDIIDSSMLAQFKACPELFNKTHILNYKPKEVSVHLHAGASFARGLEAARRAFYEQDLPAEDAIAVGLAALLRAYGDFPCPPDSAKSAERMAGAFEFYWENYGLNHTDAYPILLSGGKRAVEFSFAHPLPIDNPVTGQPLIYCGRMDAIINYGGSTLICDEKTTTSLGPTWSRQWDLRSQFLGYSWGCREAGVKVDGAVVRGVSILKTKYETQQAVIMHAEWQLARWYEELLEWIGAIIDCWRVNRWRHNFDHACSDFGGCAFRTACLSLDETPWLDTYFERRIWNPLLRTETKVS
jgi:PD-(D/E)XK nuclease superfamily